MNQLDFIKEVIADGEAFWHIEDLDQDIKELKELCKARIKSLLSYLAGTVEYQREYIFESVEDWNGCIRYLEFLEKEYLSIDGKT